MGFPPAVAFVRDFDVMVVKAVLEWAGPAGFDDDVAIAVSPTRIGNASFDITYTATDRRRARVHRRDHVRLGGAGHARHHPDTGDAARQAGGASPRLT